MAKNKTDRTTIISRFSALGDVAMTIPIVYSFALSNPEIRFVVITKTNAAKLFINRPKNLIIYGVDLSTYKGLAGICRLYKKLKETYCFDSFIDLHDVLRTKILRFLARFDGVKTSCIDKGRKEKKALTRRHKKTLIQLKNSVERYHDAFIHIGLKDNNLFKNIFDTEKPCFKDISDITTPKSPQEKWIAIAPFAMHKGKIYPAELMQQVVTRLAARNNYKIFLFGAGSHESAILESWKNQHPDNIVNMAALQKGIPAELTIFSFCDAMISMDSANMHMASLVGLPTISIWGATHPFCGFYGWQQQIENAVQLDMVCRPCSVFGNKPCFHKDYYCLHAIQPSLIIDKVDTLLNSATS